MTILVTGATGNVGSNVLARVGKERLPVRAALRDPASAPNAPDAVAFDFVDPSTWGAAFAGIETMFLIRPPAITNIKRDIVPALEAARTAGVLERLLHLTGRRRMAEVRTSEGERGVAQARETDRIALWTALPHPDSVRIIRSLSTRLQVTAIVFVCVVAV